MEKRQKNCYDGTRKQTSKTNCAQSSFVFIFGSVNINYPADAARGGPVRQQAANIREGDMNITCKETFWSGWSNKGPKQPRVTSLAVRV